MANATPRPGKRPGTHCIGSWVGPRAVWTGAGNLAPQRDFFILLRICFSCLDCLHFAFCLFLEQTKQTSIPTTEFEPAIPASDRPQTLALDRSATGVGFDPRTVQPVASRYTDWAIAVHWSWRSYSKSRLNKCVIRSHSQFVSEWEHLLKMSFKSRTC